MMMLTVLWSVVSLHLALLLAFYQTGVTAVVAEPEDAPKITVAPTDQKVLENNVASFFCRASGNPTPRVFWRRGGKRVAESHQRYTVWPQTPGGGASVLRIDPSKPRRDDGVFECVADNDIGDPAIATAKLDVYPEGQAPAGYPRIVESPTLKAVEKDRNTVMACSATGNPEPTITWLKDYFPIDVADSRLRVLPTGSLQIRQSLETDEGKYECVAENVVGVAYSYGANLYVRVRRVPPHFSIPPDSVEVMPGGAVNLTCVAIGSPMPLVKWRLGSLELTPETDIPIGKNVLKLDNIRESAVYTCVAASELGNIESDAEVRVKAMPKAPTNLQTSNVSATSVRLSWLAAVDDTSSAIESYVIQYRRKHAPGTIYDEVTDIVGTKFVLTGLNAYTTYEMRVIAVNNIGRGLPSAFVDVSTGEMLPTGAPQNFTAIGVSSTSIKLQWDPPSKNQRNGEIVLYEVLYHQQRHAVSDWTTNSTASPVMVEGLETSTDYNFQIRAYTSVGPGPWSNRLPFRTFPHYYGSTVVLPPSNVQLHRQSPTTLEVSWDPSPYPGVIGYRIYYDMHPEHAMDRWHYIDVGSHTSQEIGGLEPHSVYAVRIQAKLADNKYSNFSEVVVENKIEPDSEDMVRDFQCKVLSPHSVLLKWRPPSKLGINYYKLHYLGKQQSFKEQNMEETVIVKQERTIAKEETQVTITELWPKTFYSFNITAWFLDSTSWGPPSRLDVETWPDDLRAPDPQPVEPGHADSTVVIDLYPVSDLHGPILHYYVIVVTDLVAAKVKPDELTLEELNSVRSDSNVWIAAQFDSNLPPQMKLGDGTLAGGYTNRPLVKDEEYRVFVRAYTTDGKYMSTGFSAPFTAVRSRLEPITNADPAGRHLLLIVLPACGGVVLLLLLILIVIVLRRRIGHKSKLPEPSKMMKMPGIAGEMAAGASYCDPVEIRRQNFQTPGMMSHPPIPVNELEEHIERLRANEGARFSQEYESIEPGQQFTWEMSNREMNKSKNRYANVIAYDHSRVILQTLEGISETSYINANYMDGYRKHNAYIATQGPLPETFGDFWRMVWEQRVASVVMMTKLEERNRIKCDQYWPNRGSEVYGIMHVTLLDVVELATYTIRTFQISRNGVTEKREMRQFQFTAWPDHGVPDHPTPLLLFMRRVKAMTPPDAGPIIVHCSAGVGRTGAFIVIDAMLERIKHEKTVDIYGHVTCLRAQRNYMVQTEDQYIFIHDALLEAVQSGNTEVSARNLYMHIQKLTQPLMDGSSGMEIEFKKLVSVKVNPMKFSSATLPVNKFKNRLVNVLPYESTRVCLQPIRGVEGSDYINASFVDGYRYRRAYIVTQGPLPETTEDFWRMLWEHNSTIVVMLTKLRELGRDKCHQYWPSERSARYQYFVVDPMAEYNMPQYILREFKVTDARDGQSRTIRQFHFTDWPEQGVPKSGEGFIDFIGQVHKTKEQFGQDGPITVHCSAGVGRTGVFVTLSIVLERMRYEGIVDMYQTVKMLFAQRPAMVQTEDQYAFCYRAALEYLGSFDHYAN